MQQLPNGKYPTTFFRVSAKAIIRNDKGEVLVVKEGSDDYSLPGGGIDHGESYHEALRREMKEEVATDAEFTSTFVGVDSVYMHNKQAWLMWLVSEVAFDAMPDFGVGADASTVEFVDPRIFKDSTVRTHQLIYRWTVDRLHHVDIV